jgi:mRNA-degrading endonuclease YafQ of YafQ-DinJ toxin-antitoxin module
VSFTLRERLDDQEESVSVRPQITVTDRLFRTVPNAHDEMQPNESISLVVLWMKRAKRSHMYFSFYLRDENEISLRINPKDHSLLQSYAGLLSPHIRSECVPFYKISIWHISVLRNKINQRMWKEWLMRFKTKMRFLWGIRNQRWLL